MASADAVCSTANYTGLWIKQRGFFKLPKLLLQIRPSIFPQLFFKGVSLLLHPSYPFCNASLPPNGVRCLSLQEDSLPPVTITNHNSISMFPPLRKDCSTGKWLMQPSAQLWGAGKGVQGGRRLDGGVTMNTPCPGRSSHTGQSMEKEKIWSSWFSPSLQRLKGNTALPHLHPHAMYQSLAWGSWQLCSCLTSSEERVSFLLRWQECKTCLL